MSTLISIGAPAERATLAVHEIRALPVLVIFPHNQCNCRCVMCDIWRIREAKELALTDISPHFDSFRKLGVQWVVFSGGEPQLNEKWSFVAQLFRSEGIRVTMLTAGLLLKAQAKTVAESVDDLIVSLDGPPQVHNKVRRVRDAFEQLAEGVTALRQARPDMPIRARCTVQKANHSSLRAVVNAAREIGLNSVSFLAADLTSEAFNRAQGWPPDRAAGVALLPEEIAALSDEVDRLITEHSADFESGFIVESPQKMRRIVRHFRAHLGQIENAAPGCNAPWVSAVIEVSGDVRPCFFHPVLGNIHRQSFIDIVNGETALQFRANLDISHNEICRRCVCSLYIPRDEGNLEKG
jgi:MoaA/NifB/PqqE/SkfB family radical SAM enzyme